MRVLVLTIGTRGDVQPHLALAHGLHRAGHVVTVGTSPRYRPLLEAGDGAGWPGVAFAPLSDDLVALVETPEGRAAIAQMTSLVSGVRTVLRLLRQTWSVQQQMVRDGWAAAQAARPDVIVYHPKMAAAVAYAEALGIPAVIAPLFPSLLPTAAFPVPGFPPLPVQDLPLGRRLAAAYHRLTHRLVMGAVNLGVRWLLRPWRRAHGLPTGGGAARYANGARVPMLHAWSPHVAPAPPDWPDDGVLTTGYWFLDRASPWTPPPALAAFLAEGPPPVYVGFGSMAGRDPAATTRVVLAALRRTGRRAVLARGWGGLAAPDLPPTVHLLDAVPHGWLFPRCAAVVHHGGAGTTAAGLRAGRPTVVCPFFGDQPFWGRRVHALGAGPAPVPQARLTPARLAEALHAATHDPAIATRARTLGAAIRAEDGIARAVAFLEEMVRKRS